MPTRLRTLLQTIPAGCILRSRACPGHPPRYAGSPHRSTPFGTAIGRRVGGAPARAHQAAGPGTGAPSGHRRHCGQGAEGSRPAAAPGHLLLRQFGVPRRRDGCVCHDRSSLSAGRTFAAEARACLRAGHPRGSRATAARAVRSPRSAGFIR